MAKVQVTVVGQAELVRRLKLLGDNAVDGFRIAVNSGAMAVDRTAKQLIHRGPKTGIIYKSTHKYKDGKLTKRKRSVDHQASAPNEPPASDTGYLAAHIVTVLDMDGLGANVESQAEYSAHLEFGTKEMNGARPFMVPALEMNRQKICAAMDRAIKQAVKGR